MCLEHFLASPRGSFEGIHDAATILKLSRSGHGQRLDGRLPENPVHTAWSSIVVERWDKYVIRIHGLSFIWGLALH